MHGRDCFHHWYSQMLTSSCKRWSNGTYHKDKDQPMADVTSKGNTDEIIWKVVSNVMSCPASEGEVKVWMSRGGGLVSYSMCPLPYEGRGQNNRSLRWLSSIMRDNNVFCKGGGGFAYNQFPLVMANWYKWEGVACKIQDTHSRFWNLGSKLHGRSITCKFKIKTWSS